MQSHANHYHQLKPDVDMASTFLRTLGGETHTFQVFPERQGASGYPQIMHGTFEKQAETLARLNNKGYGIFVMVNEGDGQGRKRENVTRVRAIFADLDGAPLEPVLDCELKPSILVQSSPDRYHAYYLCKDVPLDQFTALQTEIAKRFNSDPAVKDICRVMRLCGFFHLKGEPFMTRVIDHE